MKPRTCSIEGCEVRARTRGWCKKHYARWRRHGDPLTLLQVHHPGSADERFDAQRSLNESTDCHDWTASLNAGGYGSLSVDGRTVLAHRYAWERANGPIPEGMYVDHLCRNRACVNPGHLRVVTPRVNVLENSLSLAAGNAVKTHCHRGHPFNDGNTYVEPNGNRACRRCRWLSAAKGRTRQKHQNLLASLAPTCPTYRPVEVLVTTQSLDARRPPTLPMTQAEFIADLQGES